MLELAQAALQHEEHRRLRCFDLAEGRHQAIHIAGSYSTVSEPTASALSKLVAQEKDRRFISYDPNIRASVVPDLDQWRGKVAELGPSAALIKASDEDLSQLYPGQSLENVMSDWVSAGASLAVITRGEKGAIALSSKGTSAGSMERSAVPSV
ncbi:MAG: hypothetical protein EOP94_05370 [Zymomonas sp.]|nr:MAG: hypothetical protein EOP94_05370 [Zymomonas sp.]